MKSRIWLLVILTFVLSGCVKIETGDSTRPPTLGEEVMDLYKARKAGVISEEQYEDVVRQLLELW